MMINDKALIVIDMQKDYIGESSKYRYYPNCLIDKVNERITDADKNDVSVIYVKNVSRRNKESYISDFAKELVIVSDICIEKDKSSVFADDNLIKLLQSKGIFKIEIIGIDGNCCVASSALDAAKMGFSVTLPLEYMGIKRKERFQKTKKKLLQHNIEIVE